MATASKDGDGIAAVLTEPEAYTAVSALGVFIQRVLGPGLVQAIQEGDIETQDEYQKLSRAAAGVANALRPFVEGGPTDLMVQKKVRDKQPRIIVPPSAGKIVTPGEGA